MIYLDNAATTPPDRDAVRQAADLLEKGFFNPSALYKEGFEAHKRLEEARKSILSHIAASSLYELIFTASGSEADNQALFSYATVRGNIIITAGEHAAVYNTAKELERRGVEVRTAPLNADGSVNIDSLLHLADANTGFVSVIHVNNETGAINDIEKLAGEVKKISPRAVFHSDGVQAFGKLPGKLPRNIDLYSISAHKIGGIRGAGALVRKKGVKLFPLIFGGEQENGLRSGTENTFAIQQFCYAADAKFASLEKDYLFVKELNAIVRDRLDSDLFEIISSKEASPYILSVAATGLRGEVLLHMLDDAGVIVGTGSACSSKNRFSRTILACGLNEKKAEGVLRISFSPKNTMEEVVEAVRIINRSAQNLAAKMR